MKKWFNIFQPPPHIKEHQNPEVIDKEYHYWRIRTFYSMFIGYAFFYFSRKSFTFAMPAMIQELGFTKEELGILASILSISYGCSKFFSGLLGDRSNPRYFMGVGLLMTGVCNILFGLSSSLIFFMVFWGMNGWFQGFGWPSCARWLTHWYSQSERGRWWACWNTSHNLGAALVTLLAAFCAYHWGWRFALFVPGTLCILVSFFVMNRMRDTPQSLGLPPIEQYRNDYPSQMSKEGNQEKELSVKEILFKYVLSNKWIWLLAVSYFFVYIVRTAVNDWTAVFLVENRGYTQMGAGGIVCWFEVGGFLGSLAAGWASDKLCGGKRGPVNVIFASATVLSIYGFWQFSGLSSLADSCLMFSIGFAIFGPQMLIGMSAAELSHKKAAATSTGFVGWLAYLGAATAGYPLGKIAQDWGWKGYFLTITICSVLAFLLLIPLWGVGAESSRSKPLKNPENSEELLEGLA